MSVEEIRGLKVVIRFDGNRCIHARHCVLSRPDVFVPNVPGEWIHPDNATPEQVAEAGPRLSLRRHPVRTAGRRPQRGPPKVNLVRVRENGPLAFHAQLDINNVPATRATLCRCGASKQKPYCDGSHNAAGFAATANPPPKNRNPWPSGPAR